MTLENAIKTAIEYETKIRDVYREAEAAVNDAAGKRIFEALGNDEQHHIDYLQHTLEQLKQYRENRFRKTGFCYSFPGYHQPGSGQDRITGGKRFSRYPQADAEQSAESGNRNQ